MGTSKRKLPAAATGAANERRKRVRRPLIHPLDLQNLPAKPPIPSLQSKHRTYFEFVENKEKKKKLHFQNTHDRHPPRGCEFVPIGNPELTTACKELSRERGVQIYIVSDSHFNGVARSYANQMNRVGYHFHKAIVQEARATIVGLSQQVASVPDGEPEPIPESQAQYHLQVDAALRDLFPRIPHTDRQMIIQHAFTRVIPSTQSDEKGHVETKRGHQDTRSKGEERERVGLQPNVPLARRVQLAVLAHIRHNHTRYDELLKQSGWHIARKAVEALCLDYLVKWRGDEETGRDQLEEILREIVVISDSEDDELEQSSTDNASVVELDTPKHVTASRQPSDPIAMNLLPSRTDPGSPEPSAPPGPGVAAGDNDQGKRTDRRARRGFHRYRRAWDEAIRRRDDDGHFIPPRDDQEAPNRFVERGLAGSHVSQPRLTSPASNKHLGQGPPTYMRLPCNAPTAPVSAVYGEVVSAPREQPLNEAGLHRQRPPVGHQSWDMLFRFVEPALPEPGHLPVASGIPVGTEDRLQNLSIRPSMHHRQSRAPSPALQPWRGEYSPSGRRVISDHWPHGCILPGNTRDEDLGQFFGSRDLRFSHSDSRGNTDANASMPYAARTPGALSRPATDRIVVNASWPGTHSSPILMEDRGGFFEKVASRPELVPSAPKDCESLEVRRPSRRLLRTSQEYPDVPQLPSRVLPDDFMPLGSEFTTASRSGAVSSVDSQGLLQPARVFTAPGQHEQRTMRYSPFPGGRDPYLRPVLGEPRPPSPTPYREELRIDGQPVLVTHTPYHLYYRPCRKRPASDYHYRGFGREHPLLPPYTEHVDVTQ